MPGTVDRAILSAPSLDTCADSSADGSLPTLTSGQSEEESSETGSTHPSNTFYDLSSLESDFDDSEDFAKVRPHDEDYIARARAFIASQPVFKKRLKIRVTRRMQIVVRSRVGYTQLRREVVRRRPRPVFTLEEEEPSISSAFAQLSLHLKKAFTRKGESVV